MAGAIVASGRRRATIACGGALVLLAAGGCMPRGLLDQALRAQGGPVPTLVRESEARVTMGFPGTWRWRTVVASPDAYAWTVHTTGEPTHYLFDGTRVRSFVGSALTSEDPSPTAPLRSHARFMALLQLAGLRTGGVRLRELPAAERPRDAASALEAVFADTGDRYVIGLDERRRVHSVEGPVQLPPFGRQTLRVLLADHRPVDGHAVAHRATWTLDGVPFAEERTRRACVSSRGLPATAFAAPSTLPSCP